MIRPYLRPATFARDEQSLVFLRSRLSDARSAVRAERSGSPRIPERTKAAEARLLECLEAFTAALAIRHLPIPRDVRDELRLRRLLAWPDRD